MTEISQKETHKAPFLMPKLHVNAFFVTKFPAGASKTGTKAPERPPSPKCELAAFFLSLHSNSCHVTGSEEGEKKKVSWERSRAGGEGKGGEAAAGYSTTARAFT